MRGENGDSLKCGKFTIYVAVSHEKYVTLHHESVPTKSIGTTHSIKYILIQYSCSKAPRCNLYSASHVDEGKVKLSLTLHIKACNGRRNKAPFTLDIWNTRRYIQTMT
jgi:hypothetical protein